MKLILPVVFFLIFLLLYLVFKSVAEALVHLDPVLEEVARDHQRLLQAIVDADLGDARLVQAREVALSGSQKPA